MGAERQVSACPNCGTGLEGAYCHACGQKRLDPLELTLAYHARKAAGELFHLDSKTVRSLVALLRPGRLTAEHLAGRRQPYLSPLKLYLLCAALFFLLAPFTGFTLESLLAEDRSGQLERAVATRIEARGLDRELFHERYDARLQTVYTLALGASVVAVAVFLAALYRRREPRVGAHVVFALHYVSFLYLVAPPLGALRRGLELGPLLALALNYALVAPYMFLALRRVHGESRLATAVKTVTLLALTLVVDGIVNVAALLLTLALV